ncbi:MAG: hypothetical protein JNK72_01835 [Myxococcales bacterium]|nr:hypothetical protein [Myxococcales bacterium]
MTKLARLAALKLLVRVSAFALGLAPTAVCAQPTQADDGRDPQRAAAPSGDRAGQGDPHGERGAAGHDAHEAPVEVGGRELPDPPGVEHEPGEAGAAPRRRAATVPVHTFNASDDAAERARMRTAAGRRRAPGEPEVLEMTGIPDAWFYRPRGGGMRRVFVYLHARGADPREDCRRFSAIIPRYGWLVCPVAPGRRTPTAFTWNNNAAVARRYATTAVTTLRARFARRVRATDNVIMGFSEGAFVAMQTGLAEPTIFPRWVIFAAHDGYIGLNTELYPAARAALRRVYLLTGVGDGIVERTRRADALMRRHRLGRVQMRILPGAHHELPPDFVPEVRRALTFVTAAR